MSDYETVVIGGGAAGIVAAISAKRKGAGVLLCEKNPSLGRKILASGSGRCNLLNKDLSEKYYNAGAKILVKSIFAKFGRERIKEFFKELGLELYAEEGRIFPITNQAASVLRVLEIELKRSSVAVEFNFEVVDIKASGNGFTVVSKSRKNISCNKIIITGGGKSYPALGSDGSCYRFARQFGHTIIEPVPSAVPIVAKDRLCHFLQGQKIFANAKGVIEGKVINEAGGEVLFTKYGLSGTAILDISRDLSVALNRHPKKEASLLVDMAPSITKDEFKKELTRKLNRGIPCEDTLTGILPNKFKLAMEDLLKQKDLNGIINSAKEKIFKVLGTRGWNEAEFTSGGIAVNEVKESTLESKLKKGLYFAGEILDVDGERGGYNLAWAWASGFVAGLMQ